jgi:hypothetical protein
MDRLVRAGEGVELDDSHAGFRQKPVDNEPPKLLLTSKVAMQILSCHTPKLRLVTDVSLAHSLEEAADMISRLRNTNEPPVLIQMPEQPAVNSVQPPSVVSTRDNGAASRGGEGSSATTGKIMVTQFNANCLGLRVSVDAPAGAWLLYSDCADPGWRATVDDQPRPIAVAYLAFKALHLEPGTHAVRFTFEGQPSMRFIAMAFWALGVGGAVLLLAVVCLLLLTPA